MTYTDEQWMDDWKFCFELQARRVSPTSMRAEMSNTYLAKYQDEYPERFARFWRAMTCLSQHAQEFDYASIAVVGEKQGLASRALILGLKDYFCSLDIRQIDRQFDFDAINRAVKLRT